MNELLKNMRHNSSKNKSRMDEGMPCSPSNSNKLKEKNSLTLSSVIANPKPQITVNNNQQLKNAYSTNTVENKLRIAPKGNGPIKTNEKSADYKGKIGPSLSHNNMLTKKSQSQSQNKEVKPVLQIGGGKESPQKASRVNLQLTEEDKNYITNIDVVRTPKKLNTTNFISNYTTPKNNSNAVTNRFAFSPESDHNKVLNILNPNNHITISVNNLKSHNNQNFQNAKYSSKSLAFVKAYSANTNQGIIR